MNIDSILDKYLNFANIQGPLVDNYISMYGKDATLLQNDRNNTVDYNEVYGAEIVGHGFSSNKYKRIPIKVLLSIQDWGRIINNSADTQIQVVMKYDDKEIYPGDLIQFIQRGIEVNYKVEDDISVYQRIFIRFSAKLVMNKDNR